MLTLALLFAFLSVATLVIAISPRVPLLNNRYNVAVVYLGLGAFAVAWSANYTHTVSDRSVYMRRYARLSGESGEVDWKASDPLFDLLLWLMGKALPVSEAALFGTVAALVATGFCLAYKLLLPRWAMCGIWLTFLATGFFSDYTAVALRQGLAMTLLIIAVVLWALQRPLLPTTIALLIGAALLHWSAAAISALLLAMHFRLPSVKVLMLAWLILAGLFLTGVNGVVFDAIGLQISAVDDYTQASAFDNYGARGNRPGFFALSAVLLAVGLIGLRLAADDALHKRVLSAYIAFNCVFLLLGFVAFSDRIAIYSWVLGPLLIWRPLSVKPRAELIAIVIIGTALVGFVAGPFADFISIS